RVSSGLLVTRRRAPATQRPLNVAGSGRGRLVICATPTVLTLILFFLSLPITPFSAELDWRSWVMFGAWLLVGIFFMSRLPTGIKAGPRAESELLAKVRALRGK